MAQPGLFNDDFIPFSFGLILILSVFLGSSFSYARVQFTENVNRRKSGMKNLFEDEFVKETKEALHGC